VRTKEGKEGKEGKVGDQVPFCSMAAMWRENVDAAVDSLVPRLQIPKRDQLLELVHKVILMLFVDVSVQQRRTKFLFICLVKFG